VLIEQLACSSASLTASLFDEHEAATSATKAATKDATRIFSIFLGYQNGGSTQFGYIPTIINIPTAATTTPYSIAFTYFGDPGGTATAGAFVAVDATHVALAYGASNQGNLTMLTCSP
jgi:hypothetical protein